MYLFISDRRQTSRCALPDGERDTTSHSTHIPVEGMEDAALDR